MNLHLTNTHHHYSPNKIKQQISNLYSTKTSTTTVTMHLTLFTIALAALTTKTTAQTEPESAICNIDRDQFGVSILMTKCREQYLDCAVAGQDEALPNYLAHCSCNTARKIYVFDTPPVARQVSFSFVGGCEGLGWGKANEV